MKGKTSPTELLDKTIWNPRPVIGADSQKNVPMCRFEKTSNAEMKRETSPTELLDKTIWNPRPVIDLLSRAIMESGGSFLLVLVLGPTFSALLANRSLLTNAVGIV
jgi:hypothetical protein